MPFYQRLIRPILFGLPAETAHNLGIKALKLGFAGSGFNESTRPSHLPVKLFGLEFSNPLGIAAGFDKNGAVVNELAALGFGFVEVGTVTFEPQTGNPKPRMFRLPNDAALINRLGFNNEGAERIAKRLSRLKRKCILGVNIGKNKTVPNEQAVENYLKSFDLVHAEADYIAVNISSPNTPNLRLLQQADNLEELLSALLNRNRELSIKNGNKAHVPILVKIAPDLTESEIESIVDVCLRLQISGIIATNTTVNRQGLKTKNPAKFGEGGLSGKPLAVRANEVISTIYTYSKGKLPIVGVGGIFTAEDAFAKIAAGASLLQAYTGFVYGGPTFAVDIVLGLDRILKEKGFNSLAEAVGTGLL